MTTESVEMTPPASTPPKRLRRSRTDRIGAGVAGGLGEYFALDPVIFRVLFATATFFGGAGLLAYLLAWAAIPEEGTARAPIDGWVTWLRNRRVPFWLIAATAAVIFWLVAFSWWAPGPFFPVLVVVIVLVVVFGRRGRPQPASVNLTKDPVGDAEPATPWLGESRRWIAESRDAHRERVRRSFPVRVATLLALIATLLTLGVIDAVNGIAIPIYFYVAAGILAVGLLVGMVLRRTPWGMSLLLVPAVIGAIAFGGTHARLQDGVGNRDWTPVAAPSGHYRFAFGRTTFDLRSMHPLDGPREVRVDQAAGALEILAPRSLAVRVVANVHFGVVTLDDETPDDGDNGSNVRRVIEPLTTARGPLLTIDVHLASGRINVVRE